MSDACSVELVAGLYRSRSVSAFQTTTIPGRTIQLLSVSLPTEALTLDYSSVLIEPQDPDRSPLHILIARTFISVSSDSFAIIQIMNTSPTPLTIYQGTTLGQFTLVSELLLVESQQPPLPATYSPAIPADIDLTGSVLSPDQKQELLKLLSEYRDSFATDNGSLGRTSVVKHTIHTDGHPIRQPVLCFARCYRYRGTANASKWGYLTQFQPMVLTCGHG